MSPATGSGLYQIRANHNGHPPQRRSHFKEHLRTSIETHRLDIQENSDISLIMRVLGIITRTCDVPSVLHVVECLQQRGAEKIVIVGQIPGLVENLPPLPGVHLRSLSDYPLSPSTHRRTVDWFYNWAEAKGEDDSSFQEKYRIGATSYWWFFLPFVFRDVRICCQIIDACTTVLDAEKPDHVVCVDPGARPLLPYRLDRSDDLPARIWCLVARKLGYDVTALKLNSGERFRFWATYTRRRIIQGLYKSVGESLRGSLRVFVAQCTRLGMVGLKKTPKYNGGGKHRLVHFSSPAYYRHGSGNDDEEDVIAGSLMKLLNADRGWHVVDIDTEVNLPSFREFRKLCAKVRREGIACIPIESLYSPTVKEKASKLHRELLRIWRQQRTSQAFRTSLSYRSIPLWSLLCGRFEYAFETYARIAARHVEAVSEFLMKERPSVVTIEFEEGSYGRAAIIACQALGIPSVALQHGVHSDPYIPSYYFRQTALKHGTDIRACPIATKTAVFGEFTSQNLTQISAYPVEAVAVTGSAMFDSLQSAMNSLTRVNAREALDLVKSGNVVTVMSTFTVPQERKWFVQTIMHAAKRSAPGWTWLVKLHPEDPGDDYRTMAAELGLKNVKLSDRKLWETIVASNAVVACYTSTVLDAMALKRPVISPFIVGKHDFLGLLDSGAVEPVKNDFDLCAALNRLTDPSRSHELTNRAYELLKKHVFGIEGSAAQRLADLLTELATNHEHSHGQAVT